MISVCQSLSVGTVLGDSVRAYTIEKVTDENIYLRGHPDGQRGETNTGRGALRIIPVPVITDIVVGIKSGKIQLEDILRKNRKERNLSPLFVELGVDHDPYILGYDSTIQRICEHCLSYPVELPPTVPHKKTVYPVSLGASLPKPFLLLAGISGTGKTRFVREQADASAAAERYQVKKDDNFCLVPVRPDWHEPSDLLGYISRIGSDGPRYVTTDLLHFIIAAWRHAVASSSVAGIVYKPMDSICPFWLCLDEMNLAPVEQYFADYLSILETRRWTDGTYTCDPLLKSAVIQQQLGESGKNDFWGKLNLAGDDPLSSGLRDYFSTVGIPIPPNLIVAGTVNMDETTHGFSRKVIDRALTIDFGEFFRNDYGQFFTPENRPKTFGFPVLSHITRNDLSGVKADPEGQGTIGLLEAVNGILKDTPFELAYRALNEALLSVVCFNPSDDTQLQAVWDDFLMMKVLPRIEGDADKLNSDGEASMLTRLSDILQEKLSGIWEGGRPDLLSEKAADGSPVMTFCRSKKKLAWMQNRLAVNAFTTFWP